MELTSMTLTLLIVICLWILIGIFWYSFRRFFHKNYSYFDVSFIIAYFSEQFLLIVLIELKREYFVIWISIFALIVVTTASLQKLAMDSRDKKLREFYTIERHIREETEDFNNSLIEENEKLKNQVNNLVDILRSKKRL